MKRLVNNKYMKKSICITPADENMEGWAMAVKLLNDFKLLEFNKREDFVAIIAKYNTAYQYDFKNIQQLHRFWAIRDNSPALLRDIEAVLNILTPTKK
jgi:hypothetical protein